MVTHTQNLCSAFNPPKCTLSSEHRPGAVGSHCSARGAVPCSRVSPQLWYRRWRERLYSLPPPTVGGSRDSNPQPQVTTPTLYPLGHNCPHAEQQHHKMWLLHFHNHTNTQTKCNQIQGIRFWYGLCINCLHLFFIKHVWCLFKPV